MLIKRPITYEGGNMFKQLFVCTTLVTMLMVNLVNAQEPPPTSEKAKQIEALVNKAAAQIESKGKAIFPELRKKDSEWFHGDTYLFVYDLKSNVLFNAAFPAREGTNTTGQKDANGKLFHHEFIQVAESKGSGWVDYMFPKPGQTQPSRKWAYVKAVKVDGVPSLVASGFYPE
jgi:methyl-accepting chemotaxis protein